MFTIKLTRLVRDNSGAYHRPNESVIMKGGDIPRADFDSRKMLKVQFDNGNIGVIFTDEIKITQKE